ncbi:MAG: hypothetical protein M3R36_06925 [Bacteroidota bacterium]|nr:hypothetical protein [Bacteroidota bacterium]
MKLLIAAFIFLSSNLNLYSNNSDTIIVSKTNTISISDTTHNCMVVTSKSIYKKVNLFALSDSSVEILDNNYSHDLAIDSIQSITFYGRGFWTGAVIGWSIGMLLGIISGGNVYSGSDGQSPDYNFGAGLGIGLAVGVPFGLIGGGLGALFAEDKFYNFDKLDLSAKRKKLLRLMREHADK